MVRSDVSNAPLGPGAQIGPYEIVGHLATGGMGEVYIARKRGFGGFERMVVLKIMLSHLAHDDRFARMFVDEARICSQLSHPNIVQVFDLGRSEGGALYLAMEHLLGQSVAACLKSMAQREDTIPVEIVVRMIADAANGLAYAHQATDTSGERLDLVHRDVSPENLFATYAGPVKILDFGVAKVKDRLAKTQHGEFKGKVGYMAPEIIHGQPADARADLFSLGIVLFEMLTNRRLFHAAVPATALHRVLSAPIPRVEKLRPEVDPTLAAIVHELLERDPRERIRTADETAERLEGWLAGRDVTNKVVGQWLQDAFKDAHEAHRRIVALMAETGRIDAAAFEDARRLGGEKLADTVVRELSTEEREEVADVSSVAEAAFVAEDDGWIRRARWSRWGLAIAVLIVFGFGATKLVEKSIADVRDTPREGTRYAGRYEVETVYDESPAMVLAIATDTERADERVLVRTTPPIVARRGVMLQAMSRANAALEKLEEPSLPAAASIGVEADRIFAAYRFEDGRTLDVLLEREAISGERSRALVVDIAKAVAKAHAADVVHGALEPAAIWVTQPEQKVRILGFQSGLATIHQLGNRDQGAPEQKPDVPQAPSVDQYALAALLHGLLKSMDQDGAVLAAGVLARATAVDPHARYRDVDALAKALAKALRVR